MKKYIAVLVGSFLVSHCSSMGENPDGDYLKKIQQSPQYNQKREQFVNRDQLKMDKMTERFEYFPMIIDFFFSGGKRQPQSDLPEIKPDLARFSGPTSEVKFIWFGHSTFLVNFKGTMVLFDPVFGPAAAPVSFMVERFQDPVVPLKDLPKIDYVVISHDHYDHLDQETVEFFKDKETQFVVPLGVPAHLRYWGVAAERIQELDWWDKVKLGKLEFICTPSQHFSGRGTGENKTLWASWIVRDAKTKLFYSGDTGYDTHFKDIGKKYGPFDLAFMENGQYNEKWREVHLLPDETIKAFQELRAKNLVPVHWGMFDLSLHMWYEPAEALQKNALGKNISILTPKLGQVVYLDRKNSFENWWKKHIMTGSL